MDILLRLALNKTLAKGSVWTVAILGLLFFSACNRNTSNRLNDISYAYHYRNLDSTEVYAQRAYDLAAENNDEGAAKAEALNNLAFVSLMRMDYDKAAKQLAEVAEETDNCIELFVAAVQQMRLCQRTSRNREFYTFREKATELKNRINEERGMLDAHTRRRLTYAETEFAIVTSTYYYYVGLDRQSREALNEIKAEGEIRTDTAQYLNYLYNIGAGGIIEGTSMDEVHRREFDALLECFFTARQSDYPFFAANALEAMAEHLLDAKERSSLMETYAEPLAIIAPDVVDANFIAGRMADTSLMLFKQYGDVYQTAGAHRTLASCYASIDDYESALFHLEEALSDTIINRAPELVASIREQLCVVYSAMDDKASSDYNRNIYLDMQEQTRQDRSLEARADMLDRASFQLNVMIAAVAFVIVLLVFLLWLFSYLDHRQRRSRNVDSLLLPLQQWQERNERSLKAMRERREEVDELTTVSEERRQSLERRNIDNRAKIALANSVIGFIDRMLNEVRMLTERKETDAVRADRYKYVSELVDQISQCNDVLTQWIQLRQGMLSLKIESFALQPLLDIVGKGRSAFAMKGVELIVEQTDAVVKGDRVLTLFMINTLADNARKFTPTGGTVTIAVTTTDDYVEIAVSDTGRGMSEAELSGIFSRQTLKGGHGFGLMNCRGIIEKYRKTSSLFSPCRLSAESVEGKGSRFFFRLPRGVKRMVVALMVMMSPLCASANMGLSDLYQAAAFADSAYFSNIAGTYRQTLSYADSCRHYLNRHYLRTHPNSRTLMLAKGNKQLVAPEIKWYHDSVATNYNVILDVRNESAVAALALHEWELYDYNNKVYTQLFKEMSADNTLEDYCRVTQQQQTNKTIAIVICVFVLLLILPAYYILYYRHRLYYRFCEERVDAINAVVLSDLTAEEKLVRTEPCLGENYPPRLKTVVERIVQALREAVEMEKCQTADLELAEDELRRSEHEGNSLYVCNAVLDNCLSTLKHETMFYPDRIRQLIDSDKRSVDDLQETVAYYRDLCTMIGQQSLRQLDSVPVKVAPIKATDIVADVPTDLWLIGNRNLLTYLFDLLRRQFPNAVVALSPKTDDRYAVFTVETATPSTATNLFTPSVDNIPNLICRQIVREHSEATDHRRCGIAVTNANGKTTVSVTLPRKSNVPLTPL